MHRAYPNNRQTLQNVHDVIITCEVKLFTVHPIL